MCEGGSILRGLYVTNAIFNSALLLERVVNDSHSEKSVSRRSSNLEATEGLWAHALDFLSLHLQACFYRTTTRSEDIVQDRTRDKYSRLSYGVCAGA